MLRTTLALLITCVLPGCSESDPEPDSVDDPRGPSAEIQALLKRAESGDPRAQYDVGRMYQWGEGPTHETGLPQDPEEAGKWYRKAAEQGHARAQYDLGYMYKSGEGVPPDHKEAVKWIRKAAEQGSAAAMLGLANIYEEERDAEAAFRWTRLAAEQGHAGAQSSIAAHYATGYGVPRDDVAAYAWYDVAAGKGTQTSGNDRDLGMRFKTTAARRDLIRKNVGKLTKKMTPEQIAEARKMSREIHQRIAADKKNGQRK